MNGHAILTLLDEPVLLVSEKEQMLSSVMHYYRFALATSTTRPSPSLSHRRSSLVKKLRVGYQLNNILIKCCGRLACKNGSQGVHHLWDYAY